MNDVRTEEEQIQAIKDWWKENGTQVLLVGCLVAAAYFGYGWWQNQQETQVNDALAAYDQYLQAISEASNSLDPTEAQVKTVEFMTDQLVEQHGNTHYAFLANLNTAAFDFRLGEWESAESRLSQAKAQASDEADVLLANYRHALVVAQLGNSERALDMLAESNEHFASIYAEARGDILLSLGQTTEAVTEYESALAATGDEPSRIATLEATIDSLRNGALAITTSSE